MIKGIKNYLNSKSWQILFFEISTYFFVGTLPLFLKINTIILWFFILGSIILSYKNKDWRINLKNNRLVLLTLLVLFVLGFFFSEYSNMAIKKIIKNLPLFIIPLFVLSHNKKTFNIKGIYISLGIGLFIGMLICWFQILMSIMSNNTPVEQAKYFFEWIYTSWNLVSPLDTHPSYFAILIVVFLTAIIINDNFKNIRRNRLKLGVLIFPFFLFLIETSSRIGVITLFVILLIYSVRKLRLKGLFLMIAVLFLIVFFSLKFDYLGSKFSNIFNSEGEIKIERYYRWKEIIKVFNEEDKWLLGVGLDSVDKIYERAYINGNFSLAFESNYNAHNQYIEFLVSNGILGLFVYIFVFFIFIYKTRLKQETLSFFIIFLLFSLSESVFRRSQGVFVFSFLYSLLILYGNPRIKK